MRATISEEDLKTMGRVNITVENGPPGGGLSMPLALAVGKAPSALAPPAVEGIPRAWETIRCENGTWVGDDLSFAMTWIRDGIDVSVQWGDEYLVRSDDVGHSLSCRVTASNALGSASSESGSVVPQPLDPILGTFGADVLVGTFHEGTIRGYAGDDVLKGLGGPDALYGGGGADVLRGGDGEDMLLGSPGDDRLSARDGWADTIACGGGFDVVVADPIDDVASDCERVKRAIRS